MTEQRLDAFLARALEMSEERMEAILLDQGATPQELEDGIALARRMFEEDRERLKAEILRSLSDWSAPSGKLQ